MDLTTALIIFITFVIGIYYNYKFGFKQGVTGGHLIGVYDTVEYLMKNNYISAERDSEDGKKSRVTPEELAFYVELKLHEQRRKQAGIAV